MSAITPWLASHLVTTFFLVALFFARPRALAALPARIYCLNMTHLLLMPLVVLLHWPVAVGWAAVGIALLVVAQLLLERYQWSADRIDTY